MCPTRSRLVRVSRTALGQRWQAAEHRNPLLHASTSRPGDPVLLRTASFRSEKPTQYRFPGRVEYNAVEACASQPLDSVETTASSCVELRLNCLIFWFTITLKFHASIHEPFEVLAFSRRRCAHISRKLRCCLMKGSSGS